MTKWVVDKFTTDREEDGGGGEEKKIVHTKRRILPNEWEDKGTG